MLEQSVVSFFTVHPYFVVLIIGLVMFPRLTMLIGALAGFLYSGGFFYWIGWLLVPRFTIAIVATLSYWNTNPILVLITWLYAFGGESVEKSQAVKK